jgi:hypothetical protein
VPQQVRRQQAAGLQGWRDKGGREDQTLARKVVTCGSLVRRPAAATWTRRTVTLMMVIGPGDEGEPVITIMQPDEDLS